MQASPRVIYAVDVGSTRSKQPKFAWARVEPGSDHDLRASRQIDDLVRSLCRDLEKGCSVALGLEAPLFVPVPADVSKLGAARPGESRWPFSSQAGATVALTGIYQTAWILRGIHAAAGGHDLTVDWHKWPPPDGERAILVWEALVSGTAHSTGETRDAATAAMAFLECEHVLDESNDVTCESPLSLVAAAALWAGWPEAVDLLHRPALVLKPADPYSGPVLPWTDS